MGHRVVDVLGGWWRALGPHAEVAWVCDVKYGGKQRAKTEAGSRVTLGSSSVCWYREGKNVPFDLNCTLWVLAVLRKGNAWGCAVVGK